MTRYAIGTLMIAGAVVWFTGCSRSRQEASVAAGAPLAIETSPAATSSGAAASSPLVSAEVAPPSATSASYSTAARAAAPIHVPAGTLLQIRTTSTISTKTARPGETFTGNLAEPLVIDQRVIAPRGAVVIGRVSDSNPGGRIKGVAHLAVRLTQLRLADGRTVDLQTNTLARKARTTRKRDAAKIGIGSGIGAGIGAIAGGGVGAAIGAGVGGGAGTGYVLATRGVPAVIPSETRLTFRLSNPVTVRQL